MQANFANYQSKKIAYHTIGEGQPLVFLHGFCERRSMWNGFTKGFLGKYQVIAIDLPGFGDSDSLAICSIKEMALAVNAVFETLQLEKAAIIGHSMGGYIALAFADQFPTKMERLTMFHSHPFADSNEKKILRQRARDFVAKNGTRIYLQQMIPTLFAEKFRKENKTFLQQLITQAMEIPAQVIVDTATAMLERQDQAAILQNLSCPVLYIIGDQDEAVPLDLSLEQTQLASIGKVEVLRGVGHMGMYEAPKNTFNALEDFLAFNR